VRRIIISVSAIISVTFGACLPVYPQQDASRPEAGRVLVRVLPTPSSEEDKKALDAYMQVFESEKITVTAGVELADMSRQRCGRVDDNWIAAVLKNNPTVSGDKVDTSTTLSIPPCPFWRTKTEITVPEGGTLGNQLTMYMGYQGKASLGSVADLNERTVESLSKVRAGEKFQIPYATGLKPYLLKQDYNGHSILAETRLSKLSNYQILLPTRELSLIVAAADRDCDAPPTDAEWPFSTMHLKAVLKYNNQIRSRPLKKAVIAVADTGIDVNEKRIFLNQNSREIPNNHKDDDGNGYVDDVWGANMDINVEGLPVLNAGYRYRDHGTHVAGLALGGLKDGELTNLVKERIAIQVINMVRTEVRANAGSKPSITFTIPNDFLLEAFRYAAQDPAANIINLSVEDEQNFGIDLALAGNPLLVVAAAGNDGLNIDENERYPAAVNTRDRLLSVAAYDKTGRLAKFSNWGPHNVDLAAPGCQIESILPYGKRGKISGTSQAAPLVSFTAALLYSEGLTYSQIKNRILLTTEVDHTKLGNCEGGSHCVASEGRLNIPKALRVYQDILVRQSNGSQIEMVGQVKDPCINLDDHCQNVSTIKRLIHDQGSNQGKVWINSRNNNILSRPSIIGSSSIRFQETGSQQVVSIPIAEVIDIVFKERPN
jgi:hypothetical protein